MSVDFALGTAGLKPGVVTSSTRPASPYVGQMIFETDTGKLLQYQSATTGWTPPWSTAWGLQGSIGASTVTTNLAASPTFSAITGLSVTFTAVANRLYAFDWIGHFMSTVATDVLQFGFFDGASGIQIIQARCIAASNPIFVTGRTITTRTAGAHTATVQGTRASGSGTCSHYADGSLISVFSVTDIGPNGVPV